MRLILILFPVIAPLVATTDPDKSKGILPDGECSECRISLDVSASSGSRLEYRLTDSKRIGKLIIEPVRLSKRDKNAKDFEVLGTATLIFSRGKSHETRTITLFLPMGRFAIGPTNYAGDFSALYDELKRSFKKGIEALEIGERIGKSAGAR